MNSGISKSILNGRLHVRGGSLMCWLGLVGYLVWVAVLGGSRVALVSVLVACLAWVAILTPSSVVLVRNSLAFLNQSRVLYVVLVWWLASLDSDHERGGSRKVLFGVSESRFRFWFQKSDNTCCTIRFSKFYDR